MHHGLKKLFFLFSFVMSQKKCTFATLFGFEAFCLRENARGIAQLVAFLVWDQAVACSSHAAPTQALFGKSSRGIAQLVAFLVWDQAVACSSHAAPTTPEGCEGWNFVLSLFSFFFSNINSSQYDERLERPVGRGILHQPRL